MTFVRKALCTTAIASVASVGSLAAREAKKDPAPPAPAQADALPKPGPEHEILKKDAGTWEATVETRLDPTGDLTVSKGTETNTLICGGLWLVQDFKGEFGGMPFQGHGVTGYDPAKKKYVGSWVDSMTTSMSQAESTYDADKKTMSGTLESRDPSGKSQKMHSKVEYKSDGTRVFTMSAPGPDEKDFVMMKITYKKRRLAGAAPAEN